MKNILAIYSSAAGKESTSQQLAKQWLSQQSANVIERDLASSPINHYDQQTLDAFYNTDAQQLTPQQQQILTISDKLIDEVQVAECIVLTVPMYNFGIPSTLKAWFDHIARAGKTFTFSEKGPQGLLINKKAVVILTRGSFYKDSDNDFMTPYIKQFLGFIGITDVELIYAEGTAMGEDNKTLAITNAQQALAAITL